MLYSSGFALILALASPLLPEIYIGWLLIESPLLALSAVISVISLYNDMISYAYAPYGGAGMVALFAFTAAAIFGMGLIYSVAAAVISLAVGSVLLKAIFDGLMDGLRRNDGRQREEDF